MPSKLATQIAQKHGVDPVRLEQLANQQRQQASRTTTRPRATPGLSVEAIDRFIGQGNPLAAAGGARTLLRATGGNLAGAAFLAALARKESSFGIKAGRFTNNFWGWGVHLGPNVNTSRTVEEGARKVWTGLNSGLYKGAGLNNPSAIIQKYAPPSENDTATYQSQVNQWFSQLGLSPQTNIFSGSTTPVPGAGAVPPAASPGAGTPIPGNLDAKKLMALLEGQRKRSLQGLMPGPNFQKNLQQIVSQGLPNAQVNVAGRGVGAQVAGAATTVTGAVADRSSAQAINAAKEALGIPYSWGGGTPSGPTKGFGRGANTVGFDCSSLVQMAWANAGVTLPRTTYDQIKVGTAVANIGQARPGDLLFPSTGHVQMYLGNGKVIEAPRTGGKVQIVPVRSKYIAIRRPA